MSTNHFAALDVTLGEVMTVPDKLIEVRHDTSVEQVLALMQRYGITSIPVRAAGDEQTPGDSSELLGMINLMDVVAFCVFAIAEGDAYLRVDLDNLDNLDSMAADVIGLVSSEGASEWSFKTYAASEPLNEVMYPFVAGVHRVMVTGDDGEEGLLSQTDIVRFIHRNADKFPADVLAAPIAACKGTPVTMDASSRALVGFRKMVVNDRSSVGIVDDQGVLVGNLSLSDLRGLSKASFGLLADPVGDYLRSRSATGAVRPLIKVPEGTSVQDVIKMMVEEKVHRVWIVDADGKPLGQASMSDVLLPFTDLSLPLVMPQ